MVTMVSHPLAVNPNGIPLAQAVEMCLVLYCTLDPLPVQLRACRLGRAELSGAFCMLAAAGKIADLPQSNISSAETPTSSAYWEHLFDEFLRGRLKLEPDAFARCSELLLR